MIHKILIATDKFKGALSAMEVCKAIREGLQTANQDFQIDIFPLADGGEGTAEILTYHTRGFFRETTVHNPIFQKINAKYGISEDGKTAFIEMAQASGLAVIALKDRNPMKTSTLGTGELILDAIRLGVQTIVLGIGGSATNDLGIGMAQALGYRFLDKKGVELLPTGENLIKIHQIDTRNVLPELKKVQFITAKDVNNPLFGENGAAYVYAKQKGASQVEIEYLDKGLRHFSQILENQLHISVSDIAGAGAAGGMGAGTIAFLNTHLQEGIKIVMQYTNFENQIADYQLIITGEGRLDTQTLQGKVVAGVCQKAKKFQIPVLAVCGTLDLNPSKIKELGLLYADSILPSPATLQEAMKNTSENLKNWAERFGFLISHFT